MKLTPWFPAKVKPVRKGVYQRDYGVDGLGIEFCYWDGNRWGLFGYTPDDAKSWAYLPTGYGKCKWRGLAEKPE